MATTSDIYIPHTAVACIDILGVRNLLERSDESMAAMNAVARFVKNATSSGVYVDPDLTQKESDTFEAEVYFGDSVYLFASPELPLDAQVQWLVVRVATLIAIGLHGNRPFLVRSAIATGDLRKRVVENERASREIRLGTSMLRAHRLEAAQVWVGGAVTADSPLNEEAQKWTLSYPVPTKTQRDGDRAPVAINWIGTGRTLDGIATKLHEIVQVIGSDDDALAKLRNTLEFVRRAFDTAQFSPIGLPEE